MTYSVGGLIQASDYNTFTTNSGGLNDIWATGSGDKGWGQTPFTSVSNNPPDTVTATQWAALVNNLAAAGSHTSTTITARTAPSAGQTISVLAALATDITNVTNNRGNAAGFTLSSGAFTGSVSKTTATGSGQNAWTITWTQTVTFPSANQARYFWNAGGRVYLNYKKTSTGTDIDADWNTFVGKCGAIYFTGRVNNAAQTISGTVYTGTTRLGGTGGTETTLATTTGWYSLTPGAAATTIFQLNNDTSPYTGEYIRTTAAVDSTSTILTLVTTWVQPAVSAAGTTCNISGGTATTSPSGSITGTAPTVLCTFTTPAATYLTNSWGTPTVASSVA